MQVLSQTSSTISPSCFTSRLNNSPEAEVQCISAGAVSRRVATRFGPSIDVRNRGVLKAFTPPALQANTNQHLAIVRIWNGDDCRELSVMDARAFAAQLIAAAAFAEDQNSLPDSRMPG